jgi:hypothetical protein
MLGERGHRVVDTDTGQWSHRVTLPDGSPDWIWREDAITALLASHQHGRLFVAGCKTNQGKLYSQFDHIALLSAPADVLLARIAARTSNPYGKHPGERALIPAAPRRSRTTAARDRDHRDRRHRTPTTGSSATRRPHLT